MNIDSTFFDLLATGAVRTAQDPVACGKTTLSVTAVMAATGSMVRNTNLHETSVCCDVQYMLRTKKEEEE
jgi:hypothetical protein